MKKIFTLVLGLMLTVAMFAADRRPSVTVNAPKRYEIVIDGKRFLNNYGNSVSIANMRSGRHSIQVFEVKQAFFMKTKKLVASSGFQLRNNDIQINVNRFGQLQIAESRFGRDLNDHGYGRDNDWNHGDGKDYDKNYGHDRDRDGRF